MKRALFLLAIATLMLAACGAAASPASDGYAAPGYGGGEPVLSREAAPAMEAPFAPEADTANSVDVASSAANQPNHAHCAA